MTKPYFLVLLLFAFSGKAQQSVEVFDLLNALIPDSATMMNNAAIGRRQKPFAPVLNGTKAVLPESIRVSHTIGTELHISISITSLPPAVLLVPAPGKPHLKVR